MLGAADGMFDLVECGPAQEMRIGEVIAITPEIEAVHLFDSETERSLRLS